ncbi:MAG: molybdopterin-dependent oxidoreductase [Desulfobacteraceae bacterium]|jgi:tetrathionate reductase subunit A
MKNEIKREKEMIKKLSRRDFFRLAGIGTASLSLQACGEAIPKKVDRSGNIDAKAEMQLEENVKVVHSVCLACNGRCGVRGVVKDNRLVNISGNPYHPYNMNFEPLEYNTPVSDSLPVSSPVCGKSLDSANHSYSPYRILKPLKRSGPRGSGKFEPIEWEQLIREISDGGKLFEHIGEDRDVEGMKSLNSDEPVDKNAPELGPKRNEFVFITGRLQPGRQEFIDRFVKQAMGSKNRIGHTDICGLGFRMGNWTFTEKKQWELKADPRSAEYILVFGANIYEALQPGINTYGAIVANRSSKKECEFVIVDPRATKASAHAKEWVPVKPGQDGAFAMGMIRWIIENNRYNSEFLSTPNISEANRRGFGAYSNSTHLVIVDPSHPRNGKFLRFKDIEQSAGNEDGETPVVMIQDTDKPGSAEKTGTALFDSEGTVKDASGKNIRVKTAFRLLKESVMEYSLADYSSFSGVPQAQIERIAKDFTSHGTRAAVTPYHGAGNYVSGTYASFAVAALNALVASVDMRGGYLKGGGGSGSQKTGLYDIGKFPDSVKGSGVSISREKSFYEKTSEYRNKKAKTGSGYPSERPWFPFSRGGLSVEAMSGIDQQYPYGCKVLFTYLYNPVYSIPGGYRYKETLEDFKKVPLHVSLDVAVNESNVYADYIVPDLSYIEGHYGWLTPHAPAMKFTGIRSPMVEPLTGTTEDGRPFCTETFLIDLAERIGLPGFGEQAIPDNDGKLYPLHKAEDFYLRGFANIAFNAKVPSATPEEIAYVERNYPVAGYKDIITPDQWKKVCYMLARGGIFESYEEGFEGNKFKYGVKRVALYNEELAATRNTLTGELFPGTLKYIPPVNSSGQNMEITDSDYPFNIVTYKKALHTQSRSLWFKYCMEITPENYIEIYEKDAIKLGIKEKDMVRIISKSNHKGITGSAHLTRLIRPGCVAVSFHFGHTQFGASPLKIKNGESVFAGGRDVNGDSGLISEKKYGKGINFNDIARLDEKMNNTPMVDLVGGIPDFSSTRVKVIKV